MEEKKEAVEHFIENEKRNQENVHEESKLFLSKPYNSEEDFSSEYKRLYFEQSKIEKLFLELLSEIEKSISKGNIDDFNRLSILTDYIFHVEDSSTLQNCYNNPYNPIKNTNLVILACKQNSVKILDVLFANYNNILNHFSVGVGRISILPHDKDESGHNAFYYAIRSGNIELLNTLIEKWPVIYFVRHPPKLDEILSKAYEELKLRNVLLSNEMEVFVEYELINLRFFSDNSDQKKNIKCDFNNIRERTELVLENIKLLTVEYSNTKKVDDKFLLIIKFIAQNIYTLKQLLKSTYARLPWEEIEFCLISFVSSYVKQDINLFSFSILNKHKIINHLKNFAKHLEEEKCSITRENINQFADLPDLKRETIITEITANYPEFEELYNDHQQIRDIYSLQKINDYIELSSSANAKEKEDQLVIIRVLQIIAQYLLNTLELPNLSNTISELFLLTLPEKTRKIFFDLLNSSINQKGFTDVEIMKDKDISSFIEIQNDIKQASNIVSDILYNNKMKIIRLVFEQVVTSENLEALEEVTRFINKTEVNDVILQTLTSNSNMAQQEKLEDLIKQLSNSITDITDFEKEIFSKINNIISVTDGQLKNVKNESIEEIVTLKALIMCWNKVDNNIINGIKRRASKALKIIAPQTVSRLKNIAELLIKIFQSVRLRIHIENSDVINRLICEILYTVEFGINDAKWMKDLREKFKTVGSFISIPEQNKDYNVNGEKLASKLSELKDVLNDNALNDHLAEKSLSYRGNKKTQAVVEALVLDIMMILDGSKNCLVNNVPFLDESFPFLRGKNLYKYLACGNTLVHILQSDPSFVVLENARRFISENLIKSKKKIGKLFKSDINSLKAKHAQNLATVAYQKQMFVAIEEGNLQNLDQCIKNGADIYARNAENWTALHFAAKGTSLEMVKFLLKQNLDISAKNTCGQNVLHIASANGRKNIVEFFVEDAGLSVDDTDSNGQTPLHLAAQNGHKFTVEVLLRKKDNTNIKDSGGLTPLRCALSSGHLEVVKILLQQGENEDINKVTRDVSPLHEASEFGHLQIVNFLLQNKANVNVKTETGATPLHSATFNGHLEIAKTLIVEGADVNACIVDGHTSLHYATENGHKDVIVALLKCGADPNVIEKMHCTVPLHHAASNGNEGIVKILLNYQADASIKTAEGMTALHFSAHCGHLGIVTALIAYGVNINCKNNMLLTPLHLAAEGGYPEIVNILIKNKANVNARAHKNLTPLHIAASGGHNEVAEHLIKNQAEINARDSEGMTPLHEAALNGSVNIIDNLLKNKADINSKTRDGRTPLQAAAVTGHLDRVAFLIKNKAKVNMRNNYGITPLHEAVMNGHKDIVNFLIKNKAQVNITDGQNLTPLHVAVETGHKEIAEILIANGANINARSKNTSMFLSAIKNNNKEMVKLLIQNGADVNFENGAPLFLAVYAGLKDIVDVLLENRGKIHLLYPDSMTLLHYAARRGHKEVVKSLIYKGAKVNALAAEKVTPLFYAVLEGHDEVVEILAVNGADINFKSAGMTPLHMAALRGHSNIAKFLLSKKASVNVRDVSGKTALDCAVAYNRLDMVKMFLQNKLNVNAKDADNFTLLHIAAQEGHLEMVKYLVDLGADIKARNFVGTMPIHIAAREGRKDTVEYFFSKGLGVKDLGAAQQTLLHYAVIEGHLDVVNYLIKQGSDVSVQDLNGLTPLHIAANFDHEEVVKVLLKNGAIYNSTDLFSRTPLDMVTDEDVFDLLMATKALFDAVKHNKVSEVEKCIKSGAVVNARNTDSGTALHHASWKGRIKIVNILLQNEANPNAVGDKGFTPLHYAAKFSHLAIVKTLLSHGAIYNPASGSGKTPTDLATDRNIITFLKLVSNSFKDVENGNTKIIDSLSRIKDTDTVRAIMNTRNRENSTLVVHAIQNNFSQVEKLKDISQGDLSTEVALGLVLLQQGDHKTAFGIFKTAFDKRKEILGPDNPGTLDIQTNMAKALYAQQAYEKALIMFNEILEKRTKVLGADNNDTLNTRGMIALTLHRQGKEEEAFRIYEEVYNKQKQILGINHSDTLDTQFHMAIVLDAQGKYDEALTINKEVYKKKTETLGANNPATVAAQNNIAQTLANQGKHEEALNIFKEVFKKKQANFGKYHYEPLRTLNNIATILVRQKKYDEALKSFNDILDIQKKVLGNDHPDTFSSQFNIANVLYSQGKWVSALKAYKEGENQRKAILGHSHPIVIEVARRIEVLNSLVKYSGGDVSNFIQRDINTAAANGDTEKIKNLLKDGADINDEDSDGRTTLHYAVSNGHVNAVEVLLKDGAEVTQTTKKGNTPLHIASSKGYKEIVEKLLQHVNPAKLNDFLNAKTISGGTTSLHVAVKCGSLDIIKALLKYGAMYNIANKEDKMPIDLSRDREVTNLLKLVDSCFEDAEKGDVKFIDELKTVNADQFFAVTNARNNRGNTILQVAATNGHTTVAKGLLEMIKKHRSD